VQCRGFRPRRIDPQFVSMQEESRRRGGGPIRSFSVSPHAGRGKTPRPDSARQQRTSPSASSWAPGPFVNGGCEPIVAVRRGRGETGPPPGDTRHAGPWGAVGAAEAGETKRRGGVSTGACDGWCISSVGGRGVVTKI
jgi:hypothetical protein